MATTATKTQETNGADQSVFIADKNKVKTYPREMSNNEIDFDVHVTERGKTPEDYFVNFLPLKDIQQSFKDISMGYDFSEPTKDLKAISSFVGDIPDAFKLIAEDPAYAFGFKRETSPETVQATYKPWLDLWKESEIGKTATDFWQKNAPLSESPVINLPTAEMSAQGAAQGATMGGIAGMAGEAVSGLDSVAIPYGKQVVPWFVTEFMPDQLLEFGTKAENWVGAYGIEKFGPPLIHKMLSKFPELTRAYKLSDLFSSEKALAPDFETLGLKINAKTSDVVKAYKKAAQVTHPDLVGGDGAEFIRVKNSYKRIMEARAKSINKLFDSFRRSSVGRAKGKVPLLSNERGGALLPFSEGDIVRIGKDIGQVLQVSGEIALVNVAGRIAKVPIGKMKQVKKTPEQSDLEQGLRETISEIEYIVAQETETLKDLAGGIKGGELVPGKSGKGEKIRTSLPSYLKHPKTGNKPINEKQWGELAVSNLEKGVSVLNEAENYANLIKQKDILTKQLGKTIETTSVKGSKPTEPVAKKEQAQKELTGQQKGMKDDLTKPPESALVAATPSESPQTGESAVNVNRMQIDADAKKRLVEATSEIKNEIENQTGKVLSHKEVIEAAKSAEVLSAGASREATLKFAASLLKTREELAAYAQEETITPEFLETLRIVANHSTDAGRTLNYLQIDALPGYADVKVKVLKDLIKLGKTTDEILKAAEGVDFKDEQSVAKFYRQFVKPTIPEMLDEFVYANILSSPLTHIVNTFSNIIQLAGLNPITKLTSGAIDQVSHNLLGTERSHYIADVPAFYKGAVNAVPEAFSRAVDALSGKRRTDRPDLRNLPTLAPWVDWATLKVGKYIPRLLEASDVFFKTLIESGEIEALSQRLGHEPDAKELASIQKEASERADYYVFRQRPDSENKSGQGKVLSSVDNLTNAIYRLRTVPGFKYFIRFVQTPMNILKQGLEYSPGGFATLPGAKDKTEQTAKAVIGSFVFAGASFLAANNLTTWAPPTGEKDKNDFYAAGLQPYSIRIGDAWVSYSKIGPLAYPIAMASALHYFSKESPNALSDADLDKLFDGLGGIVKFFSDQSYMQGLGDLVKFASGEKSKTLASVPTQFIPLSSLQGWVNNVMDPLQRKAEKGLSIKSVVDQIQMKLVGMSQFVPAQIDAEGALVKKQMKEFNAVSPLKVSAVNRAKLSEYRDTQKIKQEVNKIKKELSQ